MADIPGVALVTGAGSGIGRQLVVDLAARGWKVAGIARRQQPLEELERELQTRSCSFAWATADVADAAALADQVRSLEARQGPIDLLIASAGVAGDTHAVGMDPGAIAQIIQINLIGAANTIAAVLPGMLERKRGHVVAISSLASYRGLPAQMGYSASKAGLNALMESLWLDVKDHGLHVTTICPGYIDTPQAVDMYRASCLLPVEQASREILRAIEKRKRFHAFPRSTAAQLRLLRLLPSWLQDWLLLRAARSARKPADEPR
jgi:short-subunit dehydrogenase